MLCGPHEQRTYCTRTYTRRERLATVLWNREGATALVRTSRSPWRRLFMLGNNGDELTRAYPQQSQTIRKKCHALCAVIGPFDLNSSAVGDDGQV